MKLTKQRIIEIIKEEVQTAKQDSSNTKQKLRKDFINVAKEFLPDADMASAEIELTSSLLTKILKKAGEAGTSATQLRRLNDIAGKLLAEQRVSADETKREYIPAINTILFDPEYKDFNADEKINSLKLLLDDIDINLLEKPLQDMLTGLDKVLEEPLTSPDEKLKKAQQIVRPSQEGPANQPEPQPEAEPEAAEQAADKPEEPQPAEQGEVELPSGQKVIPEQFDELVIAFKEFSDDDDGFMMKTYLKDQDAMLLKLRSAMRKFIGKEGIERSLAEQEEPKPETKPEDKTKSSRESLVKYVARYRRDINNTSKVMGEYLEAAKAGTFKAQPILNKLKLQLQKLQDDNVLIVRDLKALAGLSESLLLEEETREEKIANVRKAYDNIVNDLRPYFNVSVDADLRANTEELEKYVSSVNDALKQIDSIKKYFRLAGTFNRPLEEVKSDFVEYIKKYKDTMSDLVVDLRSGVPDPERANGYANKFAELAMEIQKDFGVSPKQPIKTSDISVSTEDADDNTAAINTSPEAEQASEDQPIDDKVTEFEIEDTTLEELEAIRKEQLSFFRSIATISGEFEEAEPNLQTIKRTIERIRPSQMQEQKDYTKLYHGVKKYSDLIKEALKNVEIDELLENEMALNSFKDLMKNYLRIMREVAKVIREARGENIEKIDSPLTKELSQVLTQAGQHIDKISTDQKTKVELMKIGLQDTFLDKLRSFAYNALGGREIDVQPFPAGDIDESIENKDLLQTLIKEELKVLNGKKMVRN